MAEASGGAARKALLRLLQGRRGIAVLLVGLFALLFVKHFPREYTKVGRFGARWERTCAKAPFAMYVKIKPDEPKLIASSYLSMMAGSDINKLLLAVTLVQGDNVTIRAVVYDHEGYFQRAGAWTPLTSMDGQLTPLVTNTQVANDGVRWLDLPFEEPLRTARGSAGRGQTFFLGVVVACRPNCKAGALWLALADAEVYNLAHDMAPRMPAHFVSDFDHMSRLDYNKFEEGKQLIKHFRPDKSPSSTSKEQNFLAIQAEWSIKRPTWKACFVLCATFLAVIFITDGVPTCSAFAGLEVLFLVSQILTVEQAVQGFAQPGILTIAVFIVIAKALDDIPYVQESILWIIGRPNTLRRALAQFMAPVALMSSVIPHTAIVAMMIPTVERAAKRIGVSPSQLLMPVSFASLLGGNLTIIGSGANLIASSMFGTLHFAVFDPAPIGIVISLVALAYMVVAGPLLLPGHEPKLDDAGEVECLQAQGQPATEGLAYKLQLSSSTTCSTGCLAAPSPSFEILDAAGDFVSLSNDLRIVGKSASLPSMDMGGSWMLAADAWDSLRRSSRQMPGSTETPAVFQLPQVAARRSCAAHDRLYAIRFCVDSQGPLVGIQLGSSGICTLEGVIALQVIDCHGHTVAQYGGSEATSPASQCLRAGEDANYVFKGGEQLQFRLTPVGYHNLRSFSGVCIAPGVAKWLRRLGHRGRRKRQLVEAAIQDPNSPLFRCRGVLDSSEILSELSAVVVGVRHGPSHSQVEKETIATAPPEDWDGAAIASGDVLLLDARDSGRRVEPRGEFLLVRSVNGTSPPRIGGFGDPLRACLGVSLLVAFLCATSMPQLEVNTFTAAWVVACLYVLFDLLNFEQVLQALSSKLAGLLTLMTAIGVGEAFHQSGLVDFMSYVLRDLAELVGELVGSRVVGIHVAVFVVVSLFAAFVNMGSAAAVMAPVVQQLTVDVPGVKLKTVALMLMYASNSPFATPFGAATNIMVVSSGNYGFMDFFRFGTPLQALVMLTAVATACIIMAPDHSHSPVS